MSFMEQYQLQLEGLGSTVRSPGGVWGKAPMEIKFDAFLPENLASGGTNFSFSLTFPKNIFH